MTKKKKQDNNFRIIRIEKDSKGKDKKITMKKFFAENDAAAYSYLKKYKATANKEYTYYFDDIHSVRIADKDGKIHEYESIMESFDAERKSLPWIVRILNDVSYTLWRWFIDIPRDFCYFVRDIVYFIKYKQYYRASWSLDTYILDTIEHNLELLIKNKHGISPVFIDRARLELHKDDKDFDLAEYNNTHISSLSKDEEALAVKMQNDTFADIVKTVKLYKYYAGCGDSGDEVFDMMCNNDPSTAIPYVPGRYKCFDCKKLDKLQIKYWNKIWEQVREYGQCFWD